ncbi:unnamed protein product [Ectocarpus sp. 12 AP-2014]
MWMKPCRSCLHVTSSNGTGLSDAAPAVQTLHTCGASGFHACHLPLVYRTRRHRPNLPICSSANSSSNLGRPPVQDVLATQRPLLQFFVMGWCGSRFFKTLNARRQPSISMPKEV